MVLTQEARQRILTQNNKLKEEKKSQPISRVLSWTVIHLGYLSPNTSCNLPKLQHASHAKSFYLVLLRMGFTLLLLLPKTRCALTAPFHPYLINSNQAVFFCGTGRRFTPPRYYLASYSVEPGLSSLMTQCPKSDCLANSIRRIPYQYPPTQVFSRF